MSLLHVSHVTHGYSAFRLFRRAKRSNVLTDVSLSIEPGQCLGLLGTSGAGKSTLGKVILGLEKPQQGQVLFQGVDLYAAHASDRNKLRRDLQVVFQDCYSSVNPRMNAEQIIGEPLLNYEPLSKQEHIRRVEELLEIVGLHPEDRSKYPHQFSGGQLQRINIARAIALKPKMIVLDEAVSSLDMVTQSDILALLCDLKTNFGLSYLFITHDIKAAYHISDALAVMEQGKLAVYCADKEQFMGLQHPSVQKLVQSMLPEHPRLRSGRET
ncbi:nickel import ATP-binding protein NikE [Paenibacillus arenilitoris]|uniref:Nickel import ATP-binding protein NikE n=1 Tax=Paenibacillus arenilitoris TaxID=2772299 RepID=A0A927H9R9_9BACL|nr:nickel import ATP-binding protein NikE [Paenibacillus arenilitoris]MBD2871894.1 nickel import ATP-binding protein NikE [Paenibacillus arenilitoris]